VVEQLADSFKIKPVRILAGTFMTSLNGLGFSVSLLRVADVGSIGTSILELLDAPAEASGWSTPISSETWAKQGETKKSEEKVDEDEIQPSNLKGKSSNETLGGELTSRQWIMRKPSRP
jgi:dihydroxyacetone kinase